MQLWECILNSGFSFSYLDQVDAENEEARQKWLADKADGIVRAPDYYMTLAEVGAKVPS